MLNLKQLTVKVGDKIILKDINFHFEKGHIYAIMGPNGSGKSTLANTIMGFPNYSLDSQSEIQFLGESIKNLSPDEKAKKGIFLSLQSPPVIDGVNIYQLFFHLSKGKDDVISVKRKIEEVAGKLKIGRKLLERPLHFGLSGGEKKKIEALQVILLQPKLAIFDEIDSGVDIDSLKIIAKNLETIKNDKNTFIFISHYKKIFDYIEPDEVLIFKKGKIAAVGDIKLIKTIEKEGYQ